MQKQKNRDLGLCVTCGKTNDRLPGIRCISCQKKHNTTRRILRQNRRANKLCGCGQVQFAGVRCRKCWFENYSVKLCKSIAMAKILEEKWIKQAGKCAYSGLEMIPGKTASLDHVIPQSKTGTHASENLQWVLKTVNYMKRDMEEKEFLAMCDLIITRYKGTTVNAE